MQHSKSTFLADTFLSYLHRWFLKGIVKIAQNRHIEKLCAGNFHFTVSAFTLCRVYIMHIKKTSVFSNYRSFNKHQLWTMTFSLSMQSQHTQQWDISLCYLSHVPCGTWPQTGTSVQIKLGSGYSCFLKSTEVASCEDFWMATSHGWKENNLFRRAFRWKLLSVIFCMACPWKDHQFSLFLYIITELLISQLM